jgi:NitT/TauT family transport system substrate-binding protein
MSARFRTSAAAVGLAVTVAWLIACQPAAAPAAGQQAAPAAAPSGSVSGAAAPASASAPAPPPAERLKVAWVSVSGGYLPLWAAIEKGHFEKRGLTVEPYFTSGPQAVTSLLAREVDVAYTDGSAVVRAGLEGGQTVMLGSTTQTFPFKLIANPALRRTEDLRGKRLGITRAGTTTDFSARYLLRSVGLAADTDVALIQTGGTPEMFESLVAGGIDAGLMSEPVAHVALKQGYVSLLDLSTLGIPYPVTSFGVLRGAVNDQAAAFRAWVGGVTEAIAWIKHNRAEALEVLQRLSKIDDPESLNATYEEYVPRFPDVPYATEEMVATILESIAPTEPRAASARPADFIDNRFVRELEDSGYIRQLYGR